MSKRVGIQVGTTSGKGMQPGAPLIKAIKHVVFPARRDEMASQIRNNSESNLNIDSIKELPDRTYKNADEVIQCIQSGCGM